MPFCDVAYEMKYTKGRSHCVCAILFHYVPSLSSARLGACGARYTKGSTDVAHLSRYAFNRNINEFYSFQRKDNRLIAMLSIDGQPSSCLPPLIFEAGERAVQDFLAVMQVSYSCGSSVPHIVRK